MSPWGKIIGVINNRMSSISATDTELLNNQGWYLDKGWLVRSNQAHCVAQSLTRPWLCWKPPWGCQTTYFTTDSFLWWPTHWRHCWLWLQGIKSWEVEAHDGFISKLTDGMNTYLNLQKEQKKPLVLIPKHASKSNTTHVQSRPCQ